MLPETPPEPATPEVNSPNSRGSFGLGGLELAYPTSRSTSTSQHATSLLHSAHSTPLRPSPDAHVQAPDGLQTDHTSMNIASTSTVATSEYPLALTTEGDNFALSAPFKGPVPIGSPPALLVDWEHPVSTDQDVRSPSPPTKAQPALVTGTGPGQNKTSLAQVYGLISESEPLNDFCAPRYQPLQRLQ